MSITYTFSTGVPQIVPAVYAADDIGGTDLNTESQTAEANGVLSLSLPVGDYVAQWSWEGDKHQTSGEVPAQHSLGEIAASFGSGGGATPITGADTVYADITGVVGGKLTFTDPLPDGADGDPSALFSLTGGSTVNVLEGRAYSIHAHFMITTVDPATVNFGFNGDMTDANAAVTIVTTDTSGYVGHVRHVDFFPPTWGGTFEIDVDGLNLGAGDTISGGLAIIPLTPMP